MCGGHSIASNKNIREKFSLLPPPNKRSNNALRITITERKGVGWYSVDLFSSRWRGGCNVSAIFYKYFTHISTMLPSQSHENRSRSSKGCAQIMIEGDADLVETIKLKLGRWARIIWMNIVENENEHETQGVPSSTRPIRAGLPPITEKPYPVFDFLIVIWEKSRQLVTIVTKRTLKSRRICSKVRANWKLYLRMKKLAQYFVSTSHASEFHSRIWGKSWQCDCMYAIRINEFIRNLKFRSHSVNNRFQSRD